MEAHPERAFYRAHWPRGVYSFLELLRIARGLKDCARRAKNGPVDYRTALACIATSAETWLPKPSRVDPTAGAPFFLVFGRPDGESEASPAEVRDQLNRLATGLAAMAKVGELGLSADLHLAHAAQQSQVAIPAWLNELENSSLLKYLSKVTKDAAETVEVKKGPTTNQDVNNFLDQLLWQVEEFAGWRPKQPSKNAYRPDAPYSGTLVELATACVAPRGIKMMPYPLGAAIERAVERRDK